MTRTGVLGRGLLRKCGDSGANVMTQGFRNRDIPEEREEAHSGLTSTEGGRERNESIFTVLSVEAWIPQQATVQDSVSYSDYAQPQCPSNF
jgi:hypothetical protein